MRLIDAEELVPDLFGGSMVYYSGKVISNAPTVEAEPVRHGYWKQRIDKNWSGGGFVMCSVCRYGFSYGGYHAVEETFLYCPACGARLDEEVSQ